MTYPIAGKTYDIRHRRGRGRVLVLRVRLPQESADCRIVKGSFSGPERKEGEQICLRVIEAVWALVATKGSECEGK